MNRYLVAVVAAVLIAAPPVAAAPGPTPPPVDGAASVQTLEPSRPSTPARDEQFLADLARAGIRVGDVPTVVYGAHDTCAYLAAGHDAIEAVDTGMHNNATMTRADEIAYVDAAISVYCPRYTPLTGTLA
jgi:serine/threonine-protein kinase